MMRVLLTLIAVLTVCRAEARVFEFNKEHVSLYFGGTFGSSNAGNGAYGLSSGDGVTFDKQVQSTASGEFGLAITGGRLALKLGAEYVMPRSQTGVNGTDAGGTSLFALNSTVSAFVPEAVIEYSFYHGAASRAMIGLGGGLAFLSLNNQYTMTSAGQTRYGVGDYTEVATGTATAYLAYAAYEFVFTDTVTCVLSGGYRYLSVAGFQSTQTANTINGQESPGKDLVNTDGSPRAMNLSGGFAGLGFRFYLGL